MATISMGTGRADNVSTPADDAIRTGEKKNSKEHHRSAFWLRGDEQRERFFNHGVRADRNGKYFDNDHKYNGSCCACTRAEQSRHFA